MNHVRINFDSHLEVVKQSFINLSSDIDKACELVCNTIINGKKIILFGNGGSAADAQHIAAEFTGRFVKERRGLPAIALTTDTSALTAIGNDYGFEVIFSRQVEALANEGDLLIGISTSGNSKNVINAFKTGKLKNCNILGFSGNGGGLMTEISNINLIVPSNVTARIQEVHILIGHILCEAIDLKIN